MPLADGVLALSALPDVLLVADDEPRADVASGGEEAEAAAPAGLALPAASPRTRGGARKPTPSRLAEYLLFHVTQATGELDGWHAALTDAVLEVWVQWHLDGGRMHCVAPEDIGAAELPGALRRLKCAAYRVPSEVFMHAVKWLGASAKKKDLAEEARSSAPARAMPASHSRPTARPLRARPCTSPAPTGCLRAHRAGGERAGPGRPPR